MCGIVGLHLKRPDLHDRLGEFLTGMLDCMTTRGPDSAGIAIYTDSGNPPTSRYSLRASEQVDWDQLAADLATRLAHPVETLQRGDVVTFASPAEHADVLAALHKLAPAVTVVGYGRAMEVFKDVGVPREICDRHGVPRMSGYQGVGHTRMATESAVSTEHSHPFTPAADLALVHNGMFSNHATVRRRLAQADVHCATDNDSEVAARYVARQLDSGADLDEAIRKVLKDFDGFFTLLVATRDQFCVVRDSFACKPMVVAETGDYVAVGSEYHALVGLPGLVDADVFEPGPEEVHTWAR